MTAPAAAHRDAEQGGVADQVQRRVSEAAIVAITALRQRGECDDRKAPGHIAYDQLGNALRDGKQPQRASTQGAPDHSGIDALKEHREEREDGRPPAVGDHAPEGMVGDPEGGHKRLHDPQRDRPDAGAEHVPDHESGCPKSRDGHQDRRDTPKEVASELWNHPQAKLHVSQEHRVVDVPQAREQQIERRDPEQDRVRFGTEEPRDQGRQGHGDRGQHRGEDEVHGERCLDAFRHALLAVVDHRCLHAEVAHLLEQGHEREHRCEHAELGRNEQTREDQGRDEGQRLGADEGEQRPGDSAPKGRRLRLVGAHFLRGADNVAKHRLPCEEDRRPRRLRHSAE